MKTQPSTHLSNFLSATQNVKCTHYALTSVTYGKLDNFFEAQRVPDPHLHHQLIGSAQWGLNAICRFVAIVQHNNLISLFLGF